MLLILISATFAYSYEWLRNWNRIWKPVSTTESLDTQEKGRQIKDFMDVSSSDGMVVLKHSCSTLKFLALRCRVLCPLLFHQGGLVTVSTGGILQRAQERPCSLLHWDAWPHSDPGSNMWVKHDFTTLKGALMNAQMDSTSCSLSPGHPCKESALQNPSQTKWHPEISTDATPNRRAAWPCVKFWTTKASDRIKKLWSWAIEFGGFLWQITISNTVIRKQWSHMLKITSTMISIQMCLCKRSVYEEKLTDFSPKSFK